MRTQQERSPAQFRDLGRSGSFGDSLEQVQLSSWQNENQHRNSSDSKHVNGSLGLTAEMRAFEIHGGRFINLLGLQVRYVYSVYIYSVCVCVCVCVCVTCVCVCVCLYVCVCVYRYWQRGANGNRSPTASHTPWRRSRTTPSRPFTRNICEYSSRPALPKGRKKRKVQSIPGFFYI